MKKIITAIIVLLSVFFAFYLIGSFVEVSFNLSAWDKDTRGLIAFFGTMFSLTGFAATLQFLYERED